jgi:DnaA-homolog protein
VSGQLPLELRWPAQQRFETFVASENEVTVASLRSAAEDVSRAWIFLSGPVAGGKTHLLLAACAEATTRGRGAQYFSLTKLPLDRAAEIRGLGGSDLIALDDLDAIAADAAAEHALFDLYNRGKADGSTLLFAAKAPPAQLGIGLPDLVSRLSSCTQCLLKPLSDAERRAALRQRARARGLDLDDAVLDFLFARTQRDLGTLTGLIERIDRESLAAKRRITVPFVRQLLDGAA